ncbi:MAG: HAD family phosphatase [Lachnospiraceae bacterium]|nr:HAD family phosphatase [Lachnospiraceae bacterium]
MLEQIEAVIFDMDGTLIDSMWVWDEIDREFFRTRQIPYSKEIQHEVEGMHIEGIATYFKNKFQLPESESELITIWTQMAYEVYQKEVDYKHGVRRFLTHLKRNQIKMGIATSNSMEMVDAIKHRLNFQDYFHCIVTSAEVNVGKPAPDVYLEAAKQLNVRPENCLVFEDIPMGMLAGKNAGMKVCGVHDYSSMDQEDLKKKHCDYYIQSFHDLFSLSSEETNNEF